MKDFDNNKDGKLVELQSSLDSLRKSLTKNAASVKVLQKFCLTVAPGWKSDLIQNLSL